jgi:N-methylhydantoinase A
MFGVDVGGTFTDVVAVRDGVIEVTKVPTDASSPQAAVLEGAARLDVAGAQVFNHASTHGLNAIITRRLPKVGFLTTEGHRDMLDAGRAWRPFDGQTNPHWRRSFGDAARPLVPRYLRRGVRERISHDGTELIGLDEQQARHELAVLSRCGVAGVAICLLHSYVDPAHEQRLLALAREVLGDIPVSISSAVSPLAKEYVRASTTVIDVFMRLIYTGYATELDAKLGDLGFAGAFNFADCAATLMPWQHALDQAHRIVFAGPAGGTMASARLGRATGETNVVCCDVGGTSTDVSLVLDGAPVLNTTFELEHDMVINALSAEVTSVGAGGGSIVAVAPSGSLVVGPASAGANPGPACYGRGGTAPTVTDACLLMGILDPDGFAGGEIKLDIDAARSAFEGLDTPLPFEERVRSAYRIAVSNIGEEITNIAIRHGLDPRELTLMAYGAAGPMLLAATMDDVGLGRVVVPPHPGLFSALGLLSTDFVHLESRSKYLVLSEDTADEVETIYIDLERRLRERVGEISGAVTVRRTFDGRLLGQTWEMPFVHVPDGAVTPASVPAVVTSFHDEYERRFGQRFADLPVQGVTYRVELIIEAPKYDHPELAPGAGQELEPSRIVELMGPAGAPLAAGLYQRDTLAAGDRLTGPAVVREALSTTVVMPGQVARIGSRGEIIVEPEPNGSAA